MLTSHSNIMKWFHVKRKDIIITHLDYSYSLICLLILDLILCIVKNQFITTSHHLSHTQQILTNPGRVKHIMNAFFITFIWVDCNITSSFDIHPFVVTKFNMRRKLFIKSFKVWAITSNMMTVATIKIPDFFSFGSAFRQE
jgi:hypothetical protein